MKDTIKNFIIAYKAAMAAKFTREQLAKQLDITPEAVRKRRLRVRQKQGLALPNLPLTVGKYTAPTKDMLEIYNNNIEFQNESMSRHKKSPTVLDNTHKRFVITTAQNATPIDEKFYKAIQSYLNDKGARLIVLRTRYKNPTSIWTHNNLKDEYWAASIEEFIVDEDIQLCKGLRVLGNILIQPTAVQPLSGFDSYTGTDSAIFAHPAIQLKSVATPNKSLPKVLTTTGSITVPNYTDSKAGHKGFFNHNMSAVVVEVEDDCFHIRHIHADESGGFYDLDSYYSSTGKIKRGIRIKALVTGDSHAMFMDPQVEAATYTDPDSIINTLRPEYKVMHDVEDFYTRNHHHNGNDLIAYGKHHFGRNNVEEGLQVTADFIDRVNTPDTKTVYVKGNHEEAFDRWLREANPKIDPENSRFYYYMKYHMLKELRPTPTGFETFDPLLFWCKNPDTQRGLESIDNTIFLKRDESFVLCDVELGFHGDQGTNGSRGSVKSFAKIGPKVVIGHSHSPGIEHGAYQIGLSALMDLEYRSGPSSWLHTHCIIYQDGSRTLVNVVNGKWCLSD